MDAYDYQQLAARTLIDKPGFEIGDLDMMILWNALGLCGETAELLSGICQNNSVDFDELGDVAWYMAALCTKLEAPMRDLFESHTKNKKFSPRSNIVLAMDLCVASGKVAELAKKGICHQHGLDTSAVVDALYKVYECIWRLCANQKTTISTVFEININKLKRRYPNGFNSADSIKRVDVQKVIPAQ